MSGCSCGVIIVIQSYFQVTCSLENDVLSLDDITLDENVSGPLNLTRIVRIKRMIAVPELACVLKVLMKSLPSIANMVLEKVSVRG